MRLKTEIYYGDGADMQLARRRTAQSSFVQYLPFALFLLLLCELSEAPPLWLSAIGGTFLLGWTLHVWYLLTSDGPENARTPGMSLTFASFLISAAWLLIVYAESVTQG